MVNSSLVEVVVAKIATSLSITVNPMEGVGEYEVEGYLTRVDTGEALAGKAIHLIVDGVRVTSTTTDTLGYYLFTYLYAVEPLPPGTHTIQTQFPGDETYEGCSEEKQKHGLAQIIIGAILGFLVFSSG